MDELIKRIKRNDKKKMKKIEQEAIKKGIRNMAHKLLNLKLPIEQIMQVTGLTEEEIKSMQ